MAQYRNHTDRRLARERVKEAEDRRLSKAKPNLSLPQLASIITTKTLSIDTLRAMGQIRPDNAWVAAQGAARFLAALMKRGGLASIPTTERRLAICAGCQYRSTVGGNDYCGEPFKETANTCGCLLGGKARVASESCPSGKWPSVENDNANR